ncbi:MAG: hypothetical protein ACE366_26275 [Bradymonadia bacterium]
MKRTRCFDFFIEGWVWLRGRMPEYFFLKDNILAWVEGYESTLTLFAL